MEPGAGFYKDLFKEIEFPKEGIYSKVLAKSETYNYTIMCLAKGSGIDTHTSARSGAVIVLKGKGAFTLSGTKISMRPGVFIFMPANSSHSVEAEDNLAMLLLLTD